MRPGKWGKNSLSCLIRVKGNETAFKKELKDTIGGTSASFKNKEGTITVSEEGEVRRNEAEIKEVKLKIQELKEKLLVAENLPDYSKIKPFRIFSINESLKTEKERLKKLEE